MNSRHEATEMPMGGLPQGPTCHKIGESTNYEVPIMNRESHE